MQTTQQNDQVIPASGYRVTMLYTRRGTEDGFTVQQFKEGVSYDMANHLARYFITKGWAVDDSGDTRTNDQRMRDVISSIYGDAA